MANLSKHDGGDKRRGLLRTRLIAQGLGDVRDKGNISEAMKPV